MREGGSEEGGGRGGERGRGIRWRGERMGSLKLFKDVFISLTSITLMSV